MLTPFRILWPNQTLVVLASLICVTFNQAAWSDESHLGHWHKHEIQPTTKHQINTANASDWNRDGMLDVISSFAGEVKLYLAPRWESITLHRFTEGRTRVRPRAACIHSCLLDVNQDGRLDLIANSGREEKFTAFPNSITWIEVPENPGQAKHWIRHVFAHHDAPGGSHYMGIADVNGDGRPDISCGAKGGAGFPGGEWFAWWEQPTEPGQRWRKHLLADDQTGASNIHPVDVDGDQRVDFVATRGHSKGVLWFTAPDFKPIEIDREIEGPHSLVTTDLDRDGDFDTVDPQPDFAVDCSHIVVVPMTDSQGTFFGRKATFSVGRCGRKGFHFGFTDGEHIAVG